MKTLPLPTIIKTTILSLLLFSLLSCNKNISNDFNITKYITTQYGNYEKEGKTINYVTFNLVKNSDSVGRIITQRKERIGYILANNIDFEALKKLYPDSITIEKRFKKQLNSINVKPYIRQVIYPKKEGKNYTERQIMSVASRFILVEKRGDRGLGARICYTKNGQEAKTDILLEAVIMDAVRYNWRNAKLNPNLNAIVNSYIKKSYQENQNIKSLDSLEPIARNYVFDSMKSDLNYKKMILSYIRNNENNLPFILSNI